MKNILKPKKIKFDKQECKGIILKVLLSILVLICNAIIISGMIEILNFKEGTSLIKWMNRNEYLNSIYIVMYFQIVIYIMFHSIVPAILITNMVALTCGIINYYKLQLKGEVFQLSDLSLYKEAIDVVAGINIKISTTMIIIIVVVVMLCIFICMINLQLKIKLNKYISIILFVISLIVLCPAKSICKSITRYLNNEAIVYVPEEFYQEHGLVVGLVNTTRNPIKAPIDYSYETIKKIYNQVPVNNSSEEIKPNIIFIMNETLFDIYEYKKDVLSTDPLSNLRSYQAKFSGGKLVSPSYGGNTCQVEYEVLTGYPTFNVDGNAYTDYVKKKTDNVVTLLNSMGYDTYAFHPNIPTFFNRSHVYRDFEFNHILFEKDMVKPLRKLSHGWTDDESLYNNVIYEIENRDKTMPFYMHIVTTQNHMRHDWDFDLENEINVDKSVSQEAKQSLNTYVNLVNLADKSLKNLLDYLLTLSDPTIVVFYGDHAGGLEQWDVDIDANDRRLTPLLVWNNYGAEFKDIGYIAAYRLSGYILNLIGIQSDPYFNIMASNLSPNIVNDIIYTPQGDKIPLDRWSNTVYEWRDMIWELQYDRMFGKNYYSKLKGEGE